MTNFVWFSLLKSVKPILVPIVWFDDEARLTPDIHSELSLVLISYKVASYLKYIMPAISVLLVAITSLFLCGQVRSSWWSDTMYIVVLFSVAPFSSWSYDIQSSSTEFRQWRLRQECPNRTFSVCERVCVFLYAELSHVDFFCLGWYLAPSQRYWFLFPFVVLRFVLFVFLHIPWTKKMMSRKMSELTTGLSAYSVKSLLFLVFALS